MSHRTVLIIGIAALTVGCSTAAAPRSAPRGNVPVTATAAAVTIALSADHAASVRAYYAGNRAGNGRGRGRNVGLPPGIARNLERGKPLPPGIAKAYLPGHVLAGLPHLPSGLEYVVMAGKLLLVDAATAIVREVLLDLAFDT
jgi:hypothetical protein